MERDAALVDGLYSAFARRDLDGIRGLVSDDVEFHNPDYAVEPGVRRGVDAFVQVIDRLHDMFEYTSAEPLRVEWHGEHVVAEFRVRGRARGSGVPFDERPGHVWRIRDGKVVRMSWYRSWEEAAAAAADQAALVRGLYEAWAAGDPEAALAGVASDVEWEEPGDAPDRRRWRGAEGMLASTANWTEPFEGYGFEVLESVQVGAEQVLVGLRQWGRGRSSGAPVEAEIWHLWTVRDGLGVRMRMFRTRDEALAATAAPGAAPGRAVPGSA